MAQAPSKKLQEELEIEDTIEQRSQPQKRASDRLEEDAAKRRYKQAVLERYRVPKLAEEKRARELREERERQAKRRAVIGAVPSGVPGSGGTGSAPIALGLAGIGALLLVAGIQGKSFADVIKGEFGSKTDPEAKPGEGQTTTVGGEEAIATTGAGSAPAGFKGAPGGTVSPFPKGTKISWGRNDQGVDGTTPPGTPLRAVKNGVVEIGHDPSGFGAEYPILRTDSGQIFYYGHAEPTVHSGTRVSQGQPIARTHVKGTWGNSTTPGGFEFGEITNGVFGKPAGAAIRNWLKSLPQI